MTDEWDHRAHSPPSPPCTLRCRWVAPCPVRRTQDAGGSRSTRGKARSERGAHSLVFARAVQKREKSLQHSTQRCWGTHTLILGKTHTYSQASAALPHSHSSLFTEHYTHIGRLRNGKLEKASATAFSASLFSHPLPPPDPSSSPRRVGRVLSDVFLCPESPSRGRRMERVAATWAADVTAPTPTRSRCTRRPPRVPQPRRSRASRARPRAPARGRITVGREQRGWEGRGGRGGAARRRGGAAEGRAGGERGRWRMGRATGGGRGDGRGARLHRLHECAPLVDDSPARVWVEHHGGERRERARDVGDAVAREHSSVEEEWHEEEEEQARLVVPRRRQRLAPRAHGHGVPDPHQRNENQCNQDLRGRVRAGRVSGAGGRGSAGGRGWCRARVGLGGGWAGAGRSRAVRLSRGDDVHSKV